MQAGGVHADHGAASRRDPNEAGLPPGVLNIVRASGRTPPASAITEHPGVDMHLVHRRDDDRRTIIMRAAAEGLKEVSMELGGKAAAVIFADADLDVVVAQTIRSTFLNQGEVVSASPRLLVQRPIFDEFCKRYQAAAEALVFGDPLDEATSIGSLVDRAHYDRVASYIEIAKNEGARLLFGGGQPNLPAPFDKGAFLKPTAFVDVNNKMRICQEEVFGPVVTIRAVRHRRRRRGIANDVKYGLGGDDLHPDLQRAHRVARRVRAGIVWVNCWFVRDLRTPFGGMRESGIGREGGRLSLEFTANSRTSVSHSDNRERPCAEAEDNERLIRVGPGTPMGELFRRYWQPGAALERSCPRPTARRCACGCSAKI